MATSLAITIDGLDWTTPFTSIDGGALSQGLLAGPGGYVASAAFAVDGKVLTLTGLPEGSYSLKEMNTTEEKANLALFANADVLEYDSYTVKIEGGPVTLP